jgi:hypothetical protein
MVAITASLSVLAVARTDRVGLVWAVRAGHGSAGEEKGGEETAELHDCESGKVSIEGQVLKMLGNVRKWLDRIEET